MWKVEVGERSSKGSLEGEGVPAKQGGEADKEKQGGEGDKEKQGGEGDKEEQGGEGDEEEQVWMVGKEGGKEEA